MITLLHGDNIEASRSEFIRMKAAAKDKDIRTFDGRTIDAASLTQGLESRSMFGGETVVFIENLFGKLGRKTKLIEQLAAIIGDSASDVVVWEDKEMGTTVLKNLGKATVRLFKIPSIIFQFLDTLSLPTYQQLVQTEPPELVFSMLTRRIRQLIQLRDGVTPEGMQGWQISRLTRQAKLFTMERLLAMYKKLLDIEYSIKSGSSPFSLKQLTEQFLIDL